MAKKLFSPAMEELEVDKLHTQQEQAEKSGQFDQLYQGIKKDMELKEKAAENAEGDEESTTDDTSTEEPSPENDAAEPVEDPDVENTEAVDGDDTGAALESFLKYHYEAQAISIAQEEVFTKENVLTAGKYLGGKAVDGLKYLKDIGFEYGPVVLKHVYKGVLFALNKTVKAIVQGSVSISTYVKRRINSYENIKSNIESLREAVKLLEDKELDGVKYTNDVVINQLKIGGNYDFLSNVKVAQKFFESFFSSFDRNVKSNVIATRNLVNAVVHEQAVQPTNLVVEKFVMNGLTRREVNGYQTDNRSVESYTYNYVLPGDVAFIAWLPKRNLTSHEAVVAAYNGSKIFLGMNIHTAVVKEAVDYPSISEINKYLDTLTAICDYGIGLDKVYTDVLRTRNATRGILNSYMRFLLKAQNKISISDSMADFIALKVAYTDRAYIAGGMYANDYMVRVLTNSLSYLKDAVKAYS